MFIFDCLLLLHCQDILSVTLMLSSHFVSAFSSIKYKPLVGIYFCGVLFIDLIVHVLSKLMLSCVSLSFTLFWLSYENLLSELCLFFV